METVVVAVLMSVLALASALFSAVETAFFSLQPVQIRRLQVERPRLASFFGRFLADPRRFLSALLVADTCVNLPLILLCLYGLQGVTVMPFWASASLVFAAVVLFCELLPTMAGMRAPTRIAGWGAGWIRWILPLIDPLCRGLQRASEWVADQLTPGATTLSPAFTDEELQTLVEIGAQEGVLNASESLIIEEILKLRDKTARDSMTPRIDVFAIPDDLTHAEALTRLCNKRFHRVPVYADTPDNILGVLDVKRFLLDPQTHYTEFLTPPSYIPETMKALDLLKGFLIHPQRLAIVVDEFGGMEGIIAFSDVIEPVLYDAIPSADHEFYIENFGPGRLIVAGEVRLDDLSEHLGVDLEVEGIDTIGGLIFNRLGYLPKPGEVIELAGHLFTIRRASRHRIHEILIEIRQEPLEAADAPESQ